MANTGFASAKMLRQNPLYDVINPFPKGLISDKKWSRHFVFNDKSAVIHSQQ